MNIHSDDDDDKDNDYNGNDDDSLGEQSSDRSMNMIQEEMRERLFLQI